jgi:hypothetical protein
MEMSPKDAHASVQSRFLDAAMEWNRLREEITAFREPCSHVTEFCDLSAAHTQAEKRMRELYRALVSAPTEDRNA